MHQSVEEVEALAAEAAEAQDLAQQECITKENEWLEVAEAMRKAREIVDALPDAAQQLEYSVTHARAALQKLLAAVEGFRSFQSQLTDVAQPPVVVAAEAVADMEANEIPQMHEHQIAAVLAQ